MPRPISILKNRIFSPMFLAMIAVATVVGFACTGSGNAKEKPNFIHKPGQGPAGVVATIDGKQVSEEELVGDDKMDYMEAAKKLYDLQMGLMGKALLRTVYGEEAKKANMSLEQYIDTKVLTGDVKVTDREVTNFAKEKKIPEGQMNPQLKERIMAYLKDVKKATEVQNLIAKLSKKHKVEIYLKKPDMKVNVDVGTSPTFGKKDAKVTIVEFSDFQCPYCSKAAETVAELKKLYGNKILFAFKQFPLPMHPNAKPAAEAALCVNEQGVDKFWKYHDKLFKNADKLDVENLKKFAGEVGAKMDQFNQCFDQKKYAKGVQDDLDYGGRIGVRSTPTFFVNGKLVSGAQPIEAFKEMIDEESSSN